MRRELETTNTDAIDVSFVCESNGAVVHEATIHEAETERFEFDTDEPPGAVIVEFTWDRSPTPGRVGVDVSMTWG